MQIIIKGSFITLNEYINAERSNKYMAAKIKKDETERAYYHFLNKPKIIDYPIKIEFVWFVKGKRKDADNIAFAKKFILDGMVKSGFIKNDNLNHITGFTDDFFESDNEEVIIRINHAGTKENEVDGILNKIGTLMILN